MSFITIQGIKRRLGYHRGFKSTSVNHLRVSETAPVVAVASTRNIYDCTVKNQRQYGTCCAHATTSALEFYAGRNGKTLRLAPDFAYQMAVVDLLGFPQGSDPGLMVSDAVRALEKYGVCEETLFPYTDADFGKDPPPEAKANALKQRLLLSYECPDINSIKASIIQGFPVAGGFVVPASMEDAQTAETGDIKMIQPGEGTCGGHCVLFTGFNDNTQRFDIQNSWGVSFGRGGFGTLPYAYVTEGYAGDFHTFRALGDI